MNTGSVFGGRPSLGSWVSYSLGTENRIFPASWSSRHYFMVVNGTRCWEMASCPHLTKGASGKRARQSPT